MQETCPNCGQESTFTMHNNYDTCDQWFTCDTCFKRCSDKELDECNQGKHYARGW